LAAPVLASLASGYTDAKRMEESRIWRYPLDLVAILEHAFEKLPGTLEAGKRRRVERVEPALDRERFLKVLLGEDAHEIAETLLESIGRGATAEEIAGAIAYAAALRIAQFHTSNEFSDWDSALHSFTFANAIHQALRRAPSADVIRGVFDAAMSVYLNRFLNVLAARIPEPDSAGDSEMLLGELTDLFDRQQQVNQAGQVVGGYLFGGGRPDRLLATLGRLLLREDRNFHAIQMIEAAFRQYSVLGGSTAGIHVLVAATRYLAAHSPTVRSQEQTFRIAERLECGERLFEGS
jgi:hypothetical protein